MADEMNKEREAVARAIWALMREHEDRCDQELEDLEPSHPIWSYADAARASLAASAGTAITPESGNPAAARGAVITSESGTASAGSEPVAWRHLHEDGWEHYDAPTGSDCPGCQPLYTHPSPPEGAGWTKAKDQLPPCIDGQLYIGINSAGFACMFNAITSDIGGDVHCLYETGEESIDMMGCLDIWQPFNPPAPPASEAKGA